MEIIRAGASGGGGFRRDPLALQSRPLIGHCIGQTGFSQVNNAGGILGATYRETFVIKQDANDISLTYGNFVHSINGQNLINIRVGVEIPADSGVYFPLFFDNSRDIALEPGALAATKTLAVAVTAGTTIAVHSRVIVNTTGDKWPVGYTNVKYSADTVDYTTSALPLNTFSAAFGPLSITGNVGTETVPSIGIIGDSIAYGIGDSPDTQGFLYRALNASFPFMRYARSAETLQTYLNNTGYARRSSLNGVQYVISEYGNNDIVSRTLSQIQSDMLALWNSCAKRGANVYQTTITPRTTSTDAWATTANQTPVANFGAGSIRTQLNDWIRTVPSTDLTGVFDIADVVETARNSGIWNVSHMQGGDGIHPISAGHIAMAAAVDTSKFTV